MQKQINICDVIVGESLPEFLKNLEKVQGSSTMVELRADCIKGLKVEDVKSIAEKVKIKSIFTCRSVREGGKFSGSYDEQGAILKAAFIAKFDYVDMAFDNIMVEDLSAQDKKKLIASYHDLKETPASIEIMGAFERIREIAPAIIKIATLVNNKQDAFTLVEVLKRRRSDETLIVIGMGELGKLTRVMFPLMGSYLTYVSSDNNLAPGIMTKEELQTIYGIISKS